MLGRPHQACRWPARGKESIATCSSFSVCLLICGSVFRRAVLSMANLSRGANTSSFFFLLFLFYVSRSARFYVFQYSYFWSRCAQKAKHIWIMGVVLFHIMCGGLANNGLINYRQKSIPRPLQALSPSFIMLTKQISARCRWGT